MNRIAAAVSPQNPLGVGVIGASPGGASWAVAAHLPAIARLPELRLAAVSTSRPESARAAEAAFGVPAFADAASLIGRPEVDLVVVAVKVPHHLALVSAAIAAGKMVLSEWPLGADLGEAVDLAQQAATAKVRTAVCLQARYSPAVRKARALVAEGYVGEVLASTLTTSGMAWGPVTTRASAYLFDAKSGATVLSVPVLHAPDAVTTVLGELQTVTAVSAVRRPVVQIADAGETVKVTSPDHLSIGGQFASGAIFSAHARGGSARTGNFRWEIHGTKGDLLLTADYGNMQVADLQLSGGRDDEALTPIAVEDASGGLGANVNRLYAALVRDLRDGTHHVPDFALAVRRHHLLAAIETAASTGQAQQVPA